MDKKSLDSLSLEKLHTLYGIVTEICAEYTRMTDGYSLSTGDNKFESMPLEIREMVNERQLFVSYRLKLKNALTKKIIKEMNKYE